ncbi:hypothetical protein MRX96_048706, partial [Rhipicephalus microplus]
DRICGTLYALKLEKNIATARASPADCFVTTVIGAVVWGVCPLQAKFPHISKHHWRRITIGSSGCDREEVTNLLLLSSQDSIFGTVYKPKQEKDIATARVSPADCFVTTVIGAAVWCVCPLPAKFPHISKHHWRRITIGSSGCGGKEVTNLLRLTSKVGLISPPNHTSAFVP